MHPKAKALPNALRDALVSAAIFLAAFGICCLLSQIHDDNNPFAAQVFTLAVLLISYWTRSYTPGIICSVLGVVCVNVFFTYPFYHFNMSGVGYPLTFLVMLTVSLLVSALTTRVRKEEQIHVEAETEKIRSGLLRAISHDLRTPITGILGCSSTLLEQADLPPDQQRKLLTDIQSEANWLLRMTENILSVTRSQEGVVLRKTEEAVEEVLSSAILKFRRSTKSVLPIEILSEAPLLMVPMDAMLIEQVFVNLLENVERHAHGATRVEIWLTAKDGGAQIEIQDDGCGLRQSETSPQDDTDRGTGIGLMVCSAIVNAHGGSFAIHATDRGTAARIFLPGEEST